LIARAASSLVSAVAWRRQWASSPKPTADSRQGEEHFGPLDQYRLMAEAFDAVLSGKPVPFTTSDSVLNLGVLDAVAHSARNGAAEEV
jgi:hypothetical protein